MLKSLNLCRMHKVNVHIDLVTVSTLKEVTLSLQPLWTEGKAGLAGGIHIYGTVSTHQICAARTLAADQWKCVARVVSDFHWIIAAQVTPHKDFAEDVLLLLIPQLLFHNCSQHLQGLYPAGISSLSSGFDCIAVPVACHTRDRAPCA